ncbi:MAG TPA: hypothetical protein VHR36_05935 [Pyrinomonadaceae bacterium]|nr:hypothetical protein [Pyrinomonadaceae bacterium]
MSDELERLGGTVKIEKLQVGKGGLPPLRLVGLQPAGDKVSIRPVGKRVD